MLSFALVAIDIVEAKAL